MDWLDCHPARLGTAETPRQSSVVLSGPKWAPSNAVLLSLVQPLYWITFYFFCIHAVRLKINYLEQGHSIWGPPRTVSLVPDAAVILCFLRARQEQDKGWLGFSIASFNSPSFSGVWKYLQPPLWEQAYLQHAYLQECATHPSYLGDSPLSQFTCSPNHRLAEVGKGPSEEPLAACIPLQVLGCWQDPLMHVALSVLRTSCDVQEARAMGLLAGVPSAHGARRQAAFPSPTKSPSWHCLCRATMKSLSAGPLNVCNQ